MNTRGKSLIVTSSIDTLELKRGQKAPVGCYLNELAIPALKAKDPGKGIVLATPKSSQPAFDHQSVAARHLGDSGSKLPGPIDFAASDHSIQKSRSVRSVIEERLENYIGVSVLVGRPPIDLVQDPDLGELLRHFHVYFDPTLLLCHGPTAARAAIPEGKLLWQALVDDKEAAREISEVGAKVSFYPAAALEVAGAGVDTMEFFKPRVVQDRELITGQNPPFDHAIEKGFIGTLDRYSAAKAAA